MKGVGWLFALAFGTLLLFPQSHSYPEISYGEKCEERSIKKGKESNLLANHQAEVPPIEPTKKPKQNIVGACFEAMAVAGQAFGQAMDNLFRIRMSEESGWKKKEYEESTNRPISTLTPVLDNLQKVGSP